jgi:hypothetical protein
VFPDSAAHVLSTWVRRSALGALLAACLLGGAARGGEVSITWDRELAFDFDRSQYQTSLEQIVSQAYRAACGFLGWSREGTLRVAVLTHDHYEKQFGSDAESSQGACYSGGEIFVNGGNRLDGLIMREIAHEMTHAVLDYRGTAHRLPTWFNEGLAERVGWSQRGLSALEPIQAQELKNAAEHNSLPPLQIRGPLSPLGYLHSYAAIVFLEEKATRPEILRIAKKTLEGSPFDAAFRDATHWSTADLDRALSAWAERL